MRIALLGYGRMGQTIEKIAKERGNTIARIIDKDDDFNPEGIDVAIDFSIPEAAAKNIENCLNNNIPVVSGTTGWLQDYDKMVALCSEKKGAFLYASNFSVGVNIFFELNKVLAKMMKNIPGYTASMEETHHIHKVDAPSGTAITLAEGMIENSDLDGWILDNQEENKLPIHSIREGEVPGTHSIKYSSEVDDIFIEHKAHSRQGFALGAVIAAEWLADKQGVYSMKDVLNLN